MDSNYSMIEKTISQLVDKTFKKKLQEKGIFQCHKNISDSCIKVGVQTQFRKNRFICKECLKIVNHNTYIRLKRKSESSEKSISEKI